MGGRDGVNSFALEIHAGDGVRSSARRLSLALKGVMHSG